MQDLVLPVLLNPDRQDSFLESQGLPEVWHGQVYMQVLEVVIVAASINIFRSCIGIGYSYIGEAPLTKYAIKE